MVEATWILLIQLVYLFVDGWLHASVDKMEEIKELLIV